MDEMQSTSPWIFPTCTFANEMEEAKDLPSGYQEIILNIQTIPTNNELKM